MKKNITIVAVIIVLAIVLTGAYKKAPMNLFSKSISQEDAKAKTLDFVKNNLVQPGTEVSVKSIGEENGLYKIVFTTKDSKTGKQQENITYLTKDGTRFFPEEGVDIVAITKKTADSSNTASPAPKDMPKSDTPDVKLFVMSYCPYGTQMEKGILPVLDTLKNKIKFNLEFVSYAMHDKKELDENLRQYCIEKNNPEKLNAYLTCFLKKGQGTEADCMTSTGINSAAISSCISATDTQYKVTDNYNDKSTWNNGTYPPFNVDKEDNEKYGVQGSPTLVINDTEANAARDSASILKTICSTFNNPPEECNVQLSSAAPSPGFGEGTGSDSNASCGN
jgi:hypothetical protein